MSSIGEFVKEKRIAAGLSQGKLGNFCGVSSTEIQRIESGKRISPNWVILCEIAKTLDFSPLEILLKAGYISEDDINPSVKLKHLELLNATDLKYLQLYIDFVISKKVVDK